MSKLEALKSAFTSKASGNVDDSWKKKYQFWKMQEGATAIVRFLPDLDEENPMGFLVENLVHELHVNGERRTVPCLAMHGESCPICELSKKFYDEKNEDLGKKYYRKKSYLGQVIVVESPIEHDATMLVKLIDFGPKIFKIIQSAFQSGDLEVEPYALQGGYNFRIKKTKAGQYADYGTSSFAPKQTDVDEELVNRIELMDLKEHRTKYIPRAEIEIMLNADLTGATVATVPATQSAPTQSAPAPEAEAPASTSGSSIVEQLRQRAKAKAAATASDSE